MADAGLCAGSTYVCLCSGGMLQKAVDCKHTAPGSDQAYRHLGSLHVTTQTPLARPPAACLPP
jgi:hypothetical protein